MLEQYLIYHPNNRQSFNQLPNNYVQTMKTDKIIILPLKKIAIRSVNIFAIYGISARRNKCVTNI